MPKKVKIIQICAANWWVNGLGDDGKVYTWDKKLAEWKLLQIIPKSEKSKVEEDQQIHLGQEKLNV